MGEGARRPVRVGLDPAPEEMRAIGYRVVDWLVDDLARLSTVPVANLDSLDSLLRSFDAPLPQEPTPVEDSLDVLGRVALPHMTRVNHPRFHAYIPAPGSFHGALGTFLAAGLNPFLGSSLGGASFAALELLTLRWIAEAVGYPRDAEGIFTSGGSMANLGALAAARATCDTWRSAKVFVSEQGHASMEKAALVLGFDPGQIERIATDKTFRLQPEVVLERFRAARAAGLQPLFLSANAGSTNTGSVDPLDRLADVCAAEGVWFHVDAAYGGFAALTARGRALLAGMEHADSLTLDPHKWLYTPIGCGCLLVNRPGGLERAFSAHGDYLKDVATAEVNFFDRGPELSRPARALAVWLLMRSVGVEALRREIDADLDLAVVAEELLDAEPHFEVVHRSLSIVTFRLRAGVGETEERRAAREEALVQHLLRGGDALVSGTTLHGRSALRFVVLNHHTDEAEVRRSVAVLRLAAEAVAV
jgi:glutamate/tyrosine decarboxylase-like PLP-dependent enzyme